MLDSVDASSTWSTVFKITEIILTVILVLQWVSSTLQKPFLVQIVRNPVSAVKGWKRLQWLLEKSYFYLQCIAPVVMVFYLSIIIEKSVREQMRSSLNFSFQEGETGRKVI